MRESDITPKIIELSKELAKYVRMEIYEGCWMQTHDAKQPLGKPFLVDANRAKQEWNYSFPIPSISDCLEKLGELSKGYGADLYHRKQEDGGGYKCRVFFWNRSILSPEWTDSPLEALLSALLEVVKR